jgi:hypothetical protein
VTELETPGTGTTTTRQRRSNRRWTALLGGLVLAAAKSEGLARLIVHRHTLIVVAAGLLARSLLTVRPVATAVAIPLLLALVLGAHSLGLGLALGLGGFAVLMTLFFSISAVLHARQNRRSPS